MALRLTRQTKLARQRSINSIGLWLTVISNRYGSPIFAQIERQHKLLRDEAAVIVRLAAQAGQTAQEIVGYTGRPKNSISRAVLKLEADGAVRRAEDVQDRRASKLYLTEKGNAIFEEIFGYFADRDQRLLSVLGAQEKKELTRIMLKLLDASNQWA